MEQMNLKTRSLLTLTVTSLLLWSFLAQGIRLGQDLEGGTTLRFSLDLERAESTGRIAPGNRDRIVSETIKVIDQRINTFGLAETSITPIGEDKFEISLPAESAGDVDSISDVVTQLGDLMFRITVRPTNQYGGLESGGLPPRLQTGKAPWQGAKEGEGENAKTWPATAQGYEEFLAYEVKKWKDAEIGALPYKPTDPRYFVVPRQRKEGDTSAEKPTDFVLLEEPEAQYRFDGRIITNPVPSQGESGMPVVLYEVKTDYQKVFGDWTEANKGLPMAIVLNEEFVTDPIIQSRLSDRVQITLGAGKTYNEVKKEAESIATVLQTGSLKVKPKLESRTKVGATLAGESRNRGILAVIVAFLLVLAFMVVYYRSSGLIANFALLLNLVLLLGTLAFFKAVLTLPGIAGIVLTLGMAVDANILINERIREERRAGRTMRRALSEGYDRAFTTIVDANVTSLITAVFLYAYGSGPVRGFAVTLAVGLIVSMFTAIYVTRTIFEWLLKRGRLNEMRMLGSGVAPKIPWVALRRYFAPLSALGILFGLLVFGFEDKYTFYDVDFTGGLKLQVQCREPTSVDEVRRLLSSTSKKLTVETEEFDENENLRKVEHEVEAGPYPNANVVAVGTKGDAVEVTVQRGLEPKDVKGGGAPSVEVEEKAFEGFLHEVLGDRLVPDWLAEKPQPYKAPQDAGDEMKSVDGGVALQVNLLDPSGVLTADRLRTAVTDSMPYWTIHGSERRKNPASAVKRTVVVKPVETGNEAFKSFQIWLKSENPTSKTAVERTPDAIRATFSEFLGGTEIQRALEAQGVIPDAAEGVGLSQPFPAADVIGSSVARRLQNDALVALVLSLLGIIVYVAFRFSSRAMGLSAVLCLFHDVAFTLGVTAVANVFGWVDAKISLPMVAAFLTLVGYSVNDTVVVFDRIRENRGKKPTITPGMIDLSINQTLARSIKTSATFLLAAVALFAINVGQRNVLEGFAFILIVGSVIGTYSTVAIASPLLLFLPWHWERIRRWRPRAHALLGVPASKAWLLPLLPFTALAWLLWGFGFGLFVFASGVLLFPLWALTVHIEVEEIEPTPAAV